jgi:hypothetical protein
MNAAIALIPLIEAAGTVHGPLVLPRMEESRGQYRAVECFL